jgi:hypothetical protein
MELILGLFGCLCILLEDSSDGGLCLAIPVRKVLSLRLKPAEAELRMECGGYSVKADVGL